MKKIIVIIVMLLATTVSAQVSVSVDSSSPDPSAMLDVKSADKGLLIPRMTTTQRTGIANPADGLLVYDLSTQTFWYYKNTVWVNLGDIASWSLSGNSGINSSTSFIGTTDTAALVFKVNNIKSGILDINKWNSSWGYHTLTRTTGGSNAAFGHNSLDQNTTGFSNTAIGNGSLTSNTTGQENTAVGSTALMMNISGSENTAIGTYALANNQGGIRNVAVGNSALAGNSNGGNNTAIGLLAGYLNQGSSNVYIGPFSGYNEDGNDKLYFDNRYRNDLQSSRDQALIYGVFAETPANQKLSFNASVGIGTISPTNRLHIVSTANPLRLEGLQTSTNENYLVVDNNGVVSKRTGAGGSSWELIGNSATNPATNFIGTTDNVPLNFRVNNIQSGIIDPELSNTSLGYQTLNHNTTGKNNSAFGRYSLMNNTTGNGNVAIGHSALYTNTTGSGMVAVGDSALYNQSVGTYNGIYRNTAIGHKTLFSNTSGYQNTSTGYQSMKANTIGNSNTATGSFSLYANQEGTDNVSNGAYSLYSNSMGWQNTAIGNYALYHNTNGARNVALGYGAGQYETGNDRLYIDNRFRSDLQDSREKSLIYGVFDADPANQKLTLNANVGINTTMPDASAVLDLNSTNKGFLPPRITTAQRNTISSPAEGLVIYNTDEKALNVYNGIAWKSMIPPQPFGCGLTISINHVISGGVAPVNKTVAYGTVNGIPGEPAKCWITSNLGADHQATAVSDATEASAGWYWQFNRKQGYKHDGTTRTPNTTWITSISETSDWIAANDPCNIELGAIWRIPTYTEWYNVDKTGGWTNWNGPWGSGLKLHAAGNLDSSGGILSGRGTYCDYWSSTQSYNATSSWNLFSYSFSSSMVGTPKEWGFSLRCIRDY